MHQSLSAIQRIAALKEEIKQLEERAIIELKERRVQIAQELHDVECELGRITGKSPETGKRVKSEKYEGTIVSLAELKAKLNALPDRTLSLRREGLDVKNVKQLVAGNPTVLRLGGKGPWPTVTLVK